MRSIFVLTYGWTDQDKAICTELHPSIDSAEKSGNAFMASERRFASIGYMGPAYYRIERYNFDVQIYEEKL